ncbi:DUF4398 domain-containing protein [Leadbettera azotonutricia]|uniref:Putative lipoprotein n=1 Tax=Leadbettera azotonutricia (strain ATCC BAA-888 / DSM 13862 / ZAS-9) TaxID=545695 RepID=F5YFC9_LEAAZ|nr:DUF4398 domain-containing protein [Leadbettera azotonutricia]AEF82921.1 putative lipoprotein [Leadbettera azotonutricia ZAS-9]
MRKTVSTLLAALLVGMIFAACATPPTEDMNKAVDAVTKAENDADAVTYAANTLTRARDALTQMQSEADSKRYESAKNYAAEAIAAAEKAIADGRTGAARARDEAASLLNGLRPEIAQAENDLNAAKAVPRTQLDAAACDQDLASAKSAFDDANRSLSANNYRDAVAKAQPVRPLLSGIRSRITDATQALSRKK